MDLSAFNLSYVFGDDLREKPVDLEEYNAAIQALERAAEDNVSSEEKGKLHSKLGSLLRIVGRNDDSLKHHLISDEMLEQDITARFLNRIRMATTYQFLDQHDKAIDLLETCLEEAETHSSLSNYVDFAHQHLGKVYFEMGATDMAIEQVELALALRSKKEDAELIRSSKFALTRMKSYVKESKTTKTL